jgi:pilus assembly protein TadC
MIASGAFLMALGGGYIGRQIDGNMATFALIAFAVGIILLAQAPAIALRKRIREIESQLNTQPKI